MYMKHNLVIGIVGGMGPQAGITLFNKILCHTPAVADQEHLSTVMISFPGDIVDRTAFLEGKTDVNPAGKITEIITRLEAAGAEIIGIACNTSYAPEIYNPIVQRLSEMKSRAKVLHMPLETCRVIRDFGDRVRRVGIVCTNGTYHAGIYKDMLTDLGYVAVIPDLAFQNNVIQRLIYDRSFGIKSNPSGVSNEVKVLLEKTFLYFRKNRTDAIILGCTDLSAIITEEKIDGMFVVDSTLALAKALIRDATGVHVHSMEAQMQY